MEFLGKDFDLAKDAIACHRDTSYLADCFEKINTAISKLQGKNITLVQSKTIMCDPINKSEPYQQILSRRNFYHFSRQSKMSHSVTDNHLHIYVKHLRAVKKDTNVSFKDLLDLKVFPWLVESFASTIKECDSTCRKC